GSSVEDDDVDRMSLASVLRATGTLPPAAVCRIGRDVAHALVDLHARSLVGAPSLATIYVDGRGALLFPDGAVGTPADDLYALGVLSIDDLRRIVAPSSNPANPTPDTSSPSSSSRPVMNTERIVRGARDTLRLDEDDVIRPTVPRAVWIVVAVLGGVALVAA